MVRRKSRLSKLIFWELLLLVILALLIAYGQQIFQIGSISDILTGLLPPVLTILIVVVVTKVILIILEPVFKRALKRYISTYNVKNTWQFIKYIIWSISFIILIILLFGIVVGQQFNATIAFFVSLIIILFVLLSYRSLINFVGWLHIIFSQPIKKGDLIEIDGIKGRVAEVTTSSVMLEEKNEGLKEESYTGRRISVPNYFIFTKPIASISSTESMVWDEIRVILPTNTDYLLAEDIMAEVAKSVVGPVMKKHRKEILKKVTYAKDVPSVPTTEFSLELNGVLITLRYFCRLSQRTEIRSVISEGILKEFKKQKIRPKFEN